EEVDELLLHADVVVALGGDALVELVRDFLGQLSEQGRLRWIVVEKGRARDIGALGDFFDGYVVVANFEEELLRGLLDSGAELAAFTRPATLFRRFGQRHHRRKSTRMFRRWLSTDADFSHRLY